MMEFSTLLQQGNAWLFIPSAIVLGALHGLEPGHSKTMMAAFIVAIRGTLAQAVLLGLSATLSHTAVVWLVAMAGLYFGRNWNAAASEPYFQLASAVIIILVALWMIWRTWHQQHPAHAHEHEHEHPEHGHQHELQPAQHSYRQHVAHGSADQPALAKIIDTGHGLIRLALHTRGQQTYFKLQNLAKRGALWPANQVALQTVYADGSTRQFEFTQQNGHLESQQPLTGPLDFTARLSLGHGHHSHDFDVVFNQHTACNAACDAIGDDCQDAHERAHANDIRRRFANREVTTGQIVIFGLTGGLVPCPASITVLLLCLQLKKVALGATLVLSFSVGLALTMVASGALAALSVKQVSKRWNGFGRFARYAPFLSGGLIVLMGLFMGYQGWSALS